MEPMNATAWVRPDACDIWAPTQAPGMARQVAADITGLSRAQVNVHTTYLGGGFGRRANIDFVKEAATIAKQVGLPVQMIWSREEDTRSGWSKYRPLPVVRGVLRRRYMESRRHDRFLSVSWRS